MTATTSIYELLGRCLETAQRMEYFVATALMAADGLRSGVHTRVRDSSYVKLVRGLDKLTLGQALRPLEERVPGLLGLKSALEIALVSRNLLVHQLLAERSVAEMSTAQVAELAVDLRNIELDLQAGYRASAEIASSLVGESISRRASDLFPPSAA
jgi:hypothetical protein